MKQYIALILSLLLQTNTLAASPQDVTLREKIGQMLIIGFDGTEVNSKSSIVTMIKKNNIGGVILFDYNSRTENYDKNIESPAQVKKLNSDLQHFNNEGNVAHHRPKLPLIIAVDYEGGKVNRLGEQYGFPNTKSAAEVGMRDVSEAHVLSKNMAETLNSAGFNLNFAPVVDVNVNPNNPIIGKLERSFSEDPIKVTHFAAAYAHEFLQQKIQCAYKHFPGHGSSTQDSHLGFVDVSNTWQHYELEPYEKLIQNEDSCGVIMTAHIVNRQLDDSGLPATLSHKMLTDVLRHQLHYRGVIMTDDMQMKAISDNYPLEQALVRTINAGADVLIFGNNLSVKPQDPEHLINIIESKVRTGEIEEDRINDAYNRVLFLKNSL